MSAPSWQHASGAASTDAGGPGGGRSGFTPRLYSPAEQEWLLELGLGISNLADRATAGAAAFAELRVRVSGAGG